MTPIVRDPNAEKFDTRDLLAHAQQQAEDRKYEDFMIIDVDSHHYETELLQGDLRLHRRSGDARQFHLHQGQHPAPALDRRLSGDGRPHHALSAPRHRAGAGTRRIATSA